MSKMTSEDSYHFNSINKGSIKIKIEMKPKYMGDSSTFRNPKLTKFKI